MVKVTTIGIDVAKDVFGLHGVDGEGRVAFKKRLVRSLLLEFLSKLPPCLVGIEACSSAHYWARKIEQLGHRVRLMSPRFVKPYRKSDKNGSKGNIGNLSQRSIAATRSGFKLLYGQSRSVLRAPPRGFLNVDAMLADAGRKTLASWPKTTGYRLQWCPILSA